MLNNIKSFGMNVIPDKSATIEQTKDSIESAISGIWEPVLGYLKENDNVFSGQVLQEIEKLNSQAMRLGMTVNGRQEVHSFNYES